MVLFRQLAVWSAQEVENDIHLTQRTRIVQNGLTRLRWGGKGGEKRGGEGRGKQKGEMGEGKESGGVREGGSRNGKERK